MAELEGLKPGVQAALAFVTTHPDRCAERQASRLGLPDVPGATKWTQRPATIRLQRILDLDLEQMLQLVRGVSGLTVADQHRTGVEQGAVSGEQGAVM